MFKRLIGDQWMDEVTRGQGGLLELWGSLEDTHRGHSTPEKGEEIGFFQKCRGHLGTDLRPCICPKSSSRGQLRTGWQDWKRVNPRLRIQDLEMLEPRFSFSVPLMIDLLLLGKILTEQVFNCCLRALGALQWPAPYNGVFVSASHTFTILISNFTQNPRINSSQELPILEIQSRKNWKSH